MKSKSSLVALTVNLIIVLCLVCSGFAHAGVLLQESNFTYEGAFRVPNRGLGGDSTAKHTLARGGAALAYNSTNDSLIITSREAYAVEISIPALVIDDSVSNLNIASLLQVPGNVANDQWANLGLDGSVTSSNGALPGGFLVYNNRLIGTSYYYYDGTSSGHRSHFTASLNWATEGSQFSGMHRVGAHPTSLDNANGGFVGGYMADIPSDWQTSLGYPALTGKGSLSVIGRTSLGPAAAAFDPDTLGVIDPVPATWLVVYPIEHATLGDYGGTSLYYNRGTSLTGLVFPDGSDSLVFFGRHGLGMTGEGDSCYGSGTSDISLHGTPNGEGGVYCYDPSSSSKGDHAYPYIYQAWFYDANELLDVKNGLIEPWDVLPYARWEIPLPFDTSHSHLGGVAYDPATQRIFIVQSDSDKLVSDYEPYPIIHVFSLNLAATPQAEPVVEPTPQPAPTPEPPPVLRLQ